jgi:hypothetical protein
MAKGKKNKHSIKKSDHSEGMQWGLSQATLFVLFTYYIFEDSIFYLAILFKDI